MRPLGITLILAGLVWGVIAFNMSTTIKVPDQTINAGAVQITTPAFEVYNLELADKRKTHLLISGAIIIIGAIFFGFGSLKQDASLDAGCSRKCPKCSNPIEDTATFCKFCGEEFTPNKFDIKNGQLLIDAAKSGDFETAFNLIRDGVAAHQIDLNGRTAVDIARENRRMRIVELLLSNGAFFTDSKPTSDPQPAYKYKALEKFLVSLPSSSMEITLSFNQIESIIGEALPASATAHREWWANQSDVSNRPQARSWINAGFFVDAVNQDGKNAWIRFKRKETQ